MHMDSSCSVTYMGLCFFYSAMSMFRSQNKKKYSGTMFNSFRWTKLHVIKFFFSCFLNIVIWLFLLLVGLINYLIHIYDLSIYITLDELCLTRKTSKLKYVYCTSDIFNFLQLRYTIQWVGFIFRHQSFIYLLQGIYWLALYLHNWLNLQTDY